MRIQSFGGLADMFRRLSDAIIANMKRGPMGPAAIDQVSQ
jgi:hypothetical protein